MAAAEPNAGLDEIVSQLYAVELDTFVAERSHLTKQLRTEGRRDLAAAVAKVRKPTLSAWAVDAAARANPDRLTQLIDVGTRLRRAQEALLDGASPAALHEATDERRSIVRAFTDDAVSRVSVAGGNGDGARDEIAATFEAASLDGSLAAELAGGRLARPARAPTGFELLGFGTAPPSEPGSSRSERGTRADEARAAADAAQVEVQAKRAELEQLGEELTRAQRAVDAARAALTDAEAVAARAEREAHDAAGEASRGGSSEG